MRVFFVCFFSMVCASSPSYWRCRTAVFMGFTDAPPFDGEHVELHFIDGYNETELKETVANLERDGFVVTHSFCKELCEKEIQKTVAEGIARLEREQRLKDRWNTTQLEIECKMAMEAYNNATNENRKKWFWEKYNETVEPITTCLPYRLSNLHEEYEIHKHEPCAELDCAKRGIIQGEYIIGIPYTGPAPYLNSPYGLCNIPCASNKIKIKRL